MKTLDVPVTNMTNLKKSPAQVIKQASDSRNGVYVFNRDTPAAVVMTPKDYENLVKKINDLEDKLLDMQVEKEAVQRVQQKNHEVYSEEEVLGPNGLSDVNVDNDDGWE